MKNEEPVTVESLIKALSKWPKDLKVVIHLEGGCFDNHIISIAQSRVDKERNQVTIRVV